MIRQAKGLPAYWAEEMSGGKNGPPIMASGSNNLKILSASQTLKRLMSR
jgi:hypothetical protein